MNVRESFVEISQEEINVQNNSKDILLGK